MDGKGILEVSQGHSFCFFQLVRTIAKQKSRDFVFICSSVYLHGISSNTIRNLVTFMYESELTISQEDLSELLEVATVLEVKGLSQTGNEGIVCNLEIPGSK